MERVRAGEGDPDRAGGTPATPRSRAPVPKTARTNARSPHLTYAPVRKTRSSSPASSPFFAAARAAAGPSARPSPIHSQTSGSERIVFYLLVENHDVGPELVYDDWAARVISPCLVVRPYDDIEWKRVRCGRARSRLQLSGRSSCSSSS